MVSERLQRQIDRLLDDTDEAVRQFNWLVVRERVQAVMAMDPDNADVKAYLATAERALKAYPLPQPGPATETQQ